MVFRYYKEEGKEERDSTISLGGMFGCPEEEERVKVGLYPKKKKFPQMLPRVLEKRELFIPRIRERIGR